jgi:hypothetical protein
MSSGDSLAERRGAALERLAALEVPDMSRRAKEPPPLAGDLWMRLAAYGRLRFEACDVSTAELEALASDADDGDIRGADNGPRPGPSRRQEEETRCLV